MNCEYCGCELNAASEIATGLCTRHISLLESNKYYTGVCWKCNRITLIDEIPRRLKDVFKDKYLFTKECARCTGNTMDDVNWVTFAKFEPINPLTVGIDGKLVKPNKVSSSDGESRKIPTRSHQCRVDGVESADIINIDSLD